MQKTITILISIVITALISGTSIYYWQSKLNAQKIQKQATEIEALKNTIKSLENNVISPEDIEPEIIMPECPDYNLPIVSYGRAGLLTDTEKANLIEKFLQVFVDYYRDMPEELISLDIMVPAHPGEEYEITALFILDTNVLRQEFLFGAREENYNYWTPECMDDCEFSNAFRAKYPQIVPQTP